MFTPKQSIPIPPAIENDGPQAPANDLAVHEITPRQLECLAWVKEGKSASDIGCILGVSGRTVEKHLMKVCSHLRVKTRVQAVVRALELGLIGRAAAQYWVELLPRAGNPTPRSLVADRQS
jgi:DNA-binding CsgD family transcriptional regulator